MPIWLELMVLMLLAFTAGLGIGWAVWGRTSNGSEKED